MSPKRHTERYSIKIFIQIKTSEISNNMVQPQVKMLLVKVRIPTS